MSYEPLASRLRARLATIVERTIALADSVPVEWFNADAGALRIIGRPEYYWGPRGPDQDAAQLRLKRDFDEWSELLHLLLRSAPEALAERLKEADEGFRTWIELAPNWQLTKDRGANQRNISASAEALSEVVAVLEAYPQGEIMVVPDTNALIHQPDPTSYRVLVSAQTFTFLLLPTVLAELDELKIGHRDADIREAVKSAIRRIKGWRRQGALLDGVVVDRTITVKAAHKEPNMLNSLSWLDSAVKDDRIIASCLATQAAEPGAIVILATSDVNLQNKADAAALRVIDPTDV